MSTVFKKPTVEERRVEILETTCEVVIERGFAATRISDVAKRLGVSSSLIHYHFDSKEQLLAEAFAHYARKDVAELETDIASAPTAVERLDRLIQNSVPEGSDDLEWMLWIDGWGEALRNPMMKRISQELDEQSLEVLRRVIADGVASGELACADPQASALRLTALVDGLAIQFAAHDGMLDRGALIDHVRAIAAHEVGIDPAAFGVRVPGRVGTGEPTPATDTALRRLVATYCDAIQRRDAEAWGSTWADDAVWELPGSVHEGRDAIVAAWQTSMAGFNRVVQVAPQMLVEVDERAGTGTGRVTVQERLHLADGTVVSMTATYHDRYVRTPGGWRFAERRLEILDAG